MDVQSDQPCLETMFQEYPLLLLRPLNVLQKHVNLDFLTVFDGVEAIEKCADLWNGVTRAHRGFENGNVLSLAVFALAVEDTNERDIVITSATPLALLNGAFQYRARSI